MSELAWNMDMDRSSVKSPFKMGHGRALEASNLDAAEFYVHIRTRRSLKSAREGPKRTANGRIMKFELCFCGVVFGITFVID